jgi:hypothetical protein
VRGTIEQLFDAHGFIRGRDGRGYMFLPVAIAPDGPAFTELRKGMRVRFLVTSHPRGWRADLIRVLDAE